MRNTILGALLALLGAVVLVALARPVHAAGAEVSFMKPQEFSDAGRSAHERERTLAGLQAHLQTLSGGLPGKQVLRVQVLDVDLAGEWRRLHRQEVRVLRGATDGPLVHLRWTLADGDQALKSGEDRLTDLAYLDTRLPVADSGAELAHEKRLLSRWFQERVVAAPR